MKRGFKRLCVVASVMLAGLPLSAPAQAPSPQAISLYNLGLNAYKQGSPESAVIFFKRATDIDPNLADAQYNLGIIYQTQKRYKEAIPRFEEVLRIKPSDPDAHFQLGVILQETGKPAEAKQHFANIAPSNPRFSDAQARIASINAQLAGGGQPAAVANEQPSAVQPQQQPAQPSQPPAGYAPGTTGASAYNGYPPQSGPGSYQQTAPSQSYASPAAPQTPAYTQSQQPAATSPGTAVAPPAAQAPNPVPVLPNTTLRVIATGFNAPAGLAFDRNGNLYVANFLTNTIDRINSDGTRSRFSGGANLKGPIGLVVDDSGNVYVANYNGGNVARISPAGIAQIIATGFKKPYYLTLDQDGNLYVSQQEDNSIVRITLPRPIGARPQ